MNFGEALAAMRQLSKNPDLPLDKRRAAAAAVRAADEDDPDDRDDLRKRVAELEAQLARRVKSADEAPTEKPPSLDEVKVMLRDCITSEDEDPEDREKARKLLTTLEEDGLDDAQKKALARMPSGLHDPFRDVDRQVLVIRGVRA